MPTKRNKRGQEPEDEEDDDDDESEEEESEAESRHERRTETRRETHKSSNDEGIPAWASSLQQQVKELGESLTSLNASVESARKRPKKRAPVLEVSKQEEEKEPQLTGRRIIKLW